MTTSQADDPRRLSVFLAAVGLLLSLLLLGVHASTYLAPSRESFCQASGVLDCASVAASPSSIFLGLPWAVWGIAGYLALLLAAVQRSLWLLPLAGLSCAASIYLIAVSILEVGAVCLLCEAVHLVSLALLVHSLRRRRWLRKPLGRSAGLARIALIPAATLISCWLFLPTYWNAFSYLGSPHQPTGLTEEGDHYIGSPNPRVTVHEYTDYQCPHCKAASVRALRLVASKPDVRLVRHDNPRLACRSGTQSCLPSRSAICADMQGKFWQADRWLFTFASPRKELDLETMIDDLKLDADQFLGCVESEDAYAQARSRFQQARAHRARFVPTYLVSGKRVEVPDLPAALDEF